MSLKADLNRISYLHMLQICWLALELGLAYIAIATATSAETSWRSRTRRVVHVHHFLFIPTLCLFPYQIKRIPLRLSSLL